MMNDVVKKSIIRSINKQQGMTMISLIVVLVFVLFLVVIAMNVLPVYQQIHLSARLWKICRAIRKQEVCQRKN